MATSMVRLHPSGMEASQRPVCRTEIMQHGLQKTCCILIKLLLKSTALMQPLCIQQNNRNTTKVRWAPIRYQQIIYSGITLVWPTDQVKPSQLLTRYTANAASYPTWAGFYTPMTTGIP